jgi:hypothetical protein
VNGKRIGKQFIGAGAVGFYRPEECHVLGGLAGFVGFHDKFKVQSSRFKIQITRVFNL